MYYVSGGVNDANVDMTAAVDGNFSQRNSHYIMSEQYQLLGAYHQAESATRARFNVPSINAIARHQIYPPNRSITIPSPPQLADYREYPIPLPMNEEIAVEESNNNAAGAEDTYALLWVAPPGWTRNIPRGIARLIIRATSTVTTVANAWSGFANITFAENLKGGVYSIVNARAIAANSIAWRLNFPKMPLYQGRKFYPGGLCSEAIGNLEGRFGLNGYGMGITPFGELGKFHTFEPPTIQIFANAAAATAHEIRLDMVYLGDATL